MREKAERLGQYDEPPFVTMLSASVRPWGEKITCIFTYRGLLQNETNFNRLYTLTEQQEPKPLPAGIRANDNRT